MPSELLAEYHSGLDIFTSMFYKIYKYLYNILYIY